MGKHYQLLIGGEWVDGANGVVRHRQSSHRAHRWRGSRGIHRASARRRPRQRKRHFRPGGALLRQNAPGCLEAVGNRCSERAADLVPLIISETGATAMVGSRMQVPVAVERFERYAKGAMKDLNIPLSPSPTQATPLAPGGLIGAVVNRQPVGVVACISPYNFPLVNMVGKIAPALAVGCTVMMKPAPQDPLAVLELAEIMHEVGFPPGVVNVITSSSPAPSAALCETRDVDMVSFTGSTSVGERIFEAGGKSMKRLLLELGGKGAGLVLADADIDVAVGGDRQRMGLPQRPDLYRAHPGHRAFQPLRRVGVALAGRCPKPESRRSNRADTIVGPIISAAQRDRIESYIATGAREGAEIVVDGRRPTHMEQGSTLRPRCLPAAARE